MIEIPYATLQELYNALLEARGAIRAWHGDMAWDVYSLRSPEMRQINAAIKLAEDLLKRAVRWPSVQKEK